MMVVFCKQIYKTISGWNMMSRISFKILESKKWKHETDEGHKHGAGWQVQEGSLQCFLYFYKYLKSFNFFNENCMLMLGKGCDLTNLSVTTVSLTEKN